jgi:hypothetical protein
MKKAFAPTPLHVFFQQQYDSTVVYHRGSSWNNAPNYLIVAMHRGGGDAFTYASPYRDGLGHYYPGQLTGHFSHEDARFRATRPDTNRYLVPRDGTRRPCGVPGSSCTPHGSGPWEAAATGPMA